MGTVHEGGGHEGGRYEGVGHKGGTFLKGWKLETRAVEPNTILNEIINL